MNFGSTLPFLALSGDLKTGLNLTVIGISIVFLVLLSIMVMLYFLRMTIGKKESAGKKETPAPQAVSMSNNDLMGDQINPEELAVICAAATMVIRKPLRIKRVKLISKVHQGNWRDYAEDPQIQGG